MVNTNLTPDEVRESYRRKSSVRKYKVEDSNLKKGMEEIGIDVDDLNAAIDRGEFSYADGSG